MKYVAAICGVASLTVGISNLEYALEFNTNMCILPWIIAGLVLATPLCVSVVKGEC